MTGSVSLNRPCLVLCRNKLGVLPAFSARFIDSAGILHDRWLPCTRACFCCDVPAAGLFKETLSGPAHSFTDTSMVTFVAVATAIWTHTMASLHQVEQTSSYRCNYSLPSMPPCSVTKSYLGCPGVPSIAVLTRKRSTKKYILDGFLAFPAGITSLCVPGSPMVLLHSALAQHYGTLVSCALFLA